jgi:hypothetical protein
MEEIDLVYLEENFDEVMDGVSAGRSFLLRTPDGAGVVILPEKNPVIQEMEKQNLIKKFK